MARGSRPGGRFPPLIKKDTYHKGTKGTKVHEGREAAQGLAKTQRAFAIELRFFDGTEAVPEVQNARNEQADSAADQEKPAICWQSNQQDSNQSNGDDQACALEEVPGFALAVGGHAWFLETF